MHFLKSKSDTCGRIQTDNLKGVMEIMYVHVEDQWKSYSNYTRLISLHKKCLDPICTSF